MIIEIVRDIFVAVRGLLFIAIGLAFMLIGAFLQFFLLICLLGLALWLIRKIMHAFKHRETVNGQLESSNISPTGSRPDVK